MWNYFKNFVPDLWKVITKVYIENMKTIFILTEYTVEK